MFSTKMIQKFPKFIGYTAVRLKSKTINYMCSDKLKAPSVKDMFTIYSQRNFNTSVLTYYSDANFHNRFTDETKNNCISCIKQSTGNKFSVFHHNSRIETKNGFRNCLTFNGGFYGMKTLKFYKQFSIRGLCRTIHTESSIPQAGTKAAILKTRQRGIQKDVVLSTKRIVRRKRTKDSKPKDQEIFDVTAYATCEELDLESLVEDLRNDGLYTAFPLPEDLEDVIHAEAFYRVDNEPREILFFREGAVVFWNVPEVERNLVLRNLRKHQDQSYDPDLVTEEQENVQYIFTESSTQLVGDEIQLQIPNPGEEVHHQLEKYTFSNVLALSVKLAVWEASLEQYVDSIEYILEDLKMGKKLKISRREVLQKTGELFTLRHLINLSSDLLDIPDFYWNRESLEILYRKTQNQLHIGKRVKVMNEKLNHCCELTELLREQLNDKHHTNLEWLIIFLIAVEVMFEILRMAGISH